VRWNFFAVAEDDEDSAALVDAGKLFSDGVEDGIVEVGA
jgi:hypothetical protein